MTIRSLLRPPATAIVVPVPEAAAVVGASAEPGMPPHITLLWPFARRPRRPHVAGLAAVAAEHTAFSFELTHVGEFPGVTYLAPEPAAPFVALTEALVTRWPGHQPYAGEFDAVIPHLTVRFGPPLAAAERQQLERALPLRCTADALSLLAPHRTRTGETGWVERYRAPFLPASPA